MAKSPGRRRPAARSRSDRRGGPKGLATERRALRRLGLAVLLGALVLGACSCDLIKYRDVRRTAIRYCETDHSVNWVQRRHLVSETALRYSGYFRPFASTPKMEYGPGRISTFEVEKIMVDWPLATVVIRASFDIPPALPALGERVTVPEDSQFRVKIYLRREHDLWKVDELATKKQWISTAIGPTYAEAWIKAVISSQPEPSGSD